MRRIASLCLQARTRSSGRHVAWLPASACLGLLALTFPGGVFGQSPQELAQAAGAAMDAQNYPAAEQSYLKLVEVVPTVGELYSNLGLAQFFQGKTSPAAKSFQQALKLKPDLFVAQYFLGRVYFETSKYSEALPLLEAASKAQPQQHDVLRLLAGTLVELQRPQQAIQRYRKFLSASPKDVEAYYGLGLVYLNLARATIDRLAKFQDSGFVSLVRAEYFADRAEWEDVAESSFRQAVEKSPDVPVLRNRLGLFLLKQGELDQAGAAFEEELKLAPQSCEARLGLSAVHLRRGDLDAALLQVSEAAKVRPQFFEPLPAFSCWCELPDLAGAADRLQQEAGQGSFAAAYLLSQLAAEPAKWTGVAAGLLAKIAPADIAPTNSSGGKAQAEPEKLARARELFKSERFQELVEAVPVAPAENPEMLYLLGGAYKQLALSTLQQMAELNPESARAHTLVGDWLVTQARFAEAATTYEAAVRLAPKDTELRFALGDAYFRSEQFEAAGETYRQLLAMNPNDARAYSMLGGVELRLNRPKDAIVSLEKALELNPSLAAAHGALGKALAIENRVEEAIRHLEMAAASDEDGSVHYRLSQLYRDAGNSQKARAALEEFQRLRSEQKKGVPDLYKLGQGRQ
jgi:tetratricopeptide (TPR) repeat protein